MTERAWFERNFPGVRPAGLFPRERPGMVGDGEWKEVRCVDEKKERRACEACGAPINPLTGECRCSD